MKSALLASILFFLVNGSAVGQVQDSSNLVDVVYLKDGSTLMGRIIQWDMDRGMDFQLSTGATIAISKADIKKVTQNTSPEFEGIPVDSVTTYVRTPKIYNFRERGWYNTTSGFFNLSFSGGAGVHHAMGYRFNRLLGVGVGTGVETHDFDFVRRFIPVYVEARGFLLPKKISPYYALKIGWGFALKDDVSGTVAAKGGFHFSPEVGVRFGAGEVSYYLGLEYKLQNGSFTWNGWDFSGGTLVTDHISYRRIELRTGLLF
ncbi:MAG: hypothetical protein M3R25_05510 [Bacteroidota bacterium]|nr:hypothetical protein [Bacteroidota bacterium]